MGQVISNPPGKITPEQKPLMTDTQKHYMRKCEEFNKERVAELRIQRKYGRVIGISLGAMAFGIYLYTLYAVKQEDLLEDFDKLPPDMRSSNEKNKF